MSFPPIRKTYVLSRIASIILRIFWRSVSGSFGLASFFSASVSSPAEHGGVLRVRARKRNEEQSRGPDKNRRKNEEPFHSELPNNSVETDVRT
jgi:hypothetical protein